MTKARRGGARAASSAPAPAPKASERASAPASRAAAKAAPAPTVLVVTPPGWSASTGQRPFSLSLDDLQKAQALGAKASKPKPKLKAKVKPPPARVAPAWTLLAWLGAATCVVLAALRLGDPDRGAWVLGYLVVAGLLVAVALHRSIGRALRHVLAPAEPKPRGRGKGAARRR